jgi:hypothetical protein
MRWCAVFAVLGTAATSHADTPEDRARNVLTMQLTAIADPHALVATLSPDAVIFGNGSVALAHGPDAEAIAATLAGDAPVVWTSILRLDAAGTVDAVWWTADVRLMRRAPQGRRSGWITNERIVELLVADGPSWRVAVFAFASSSQQRAPSATLAAAGDGPLTKALAQPGMYDDDWKYRRARVERAIETHGGGWGFALADVAIDQDEHAWWKHAQRLRALAIAVPDRDAKWRVVALHVEHVQ